ncbi:MAG TPA: SUF system NifU family Fe-S cluster assembly protein [bacterium]|nr:SUF system NifU family Fe-S cluster assembly protein [bacterium]
MSDPIHRDDVELGSLYRDTVLDHFRSPRGRHPLDRVDLSRQGHNPVCGDRLTLSLKLQGDTIEDVAVETKGCAISVASGSMLAELVPGLTKDQARHLAESFRAMMHGGPAPKDVDIGDLDALEGVKNFPVRVKCALLAWMTLLDALSGAADSKGVTVTED